MISKRNVLTDSEIVTEIKNYVDENLYNYAVMIDGEWGCGKTWFIKNVLREELETHEKDKSENDEEYKAKKVIYLSLYGVKTTDEVTKQLLMESLLSRTESAKVVVKKGLNAVSAILPVAFDVMKSNGLELDPNNISDLVEKFVTIKNNILIFDDLERCSLPVNEILGYINTFVEHEEMKVIIIANQKEIGKGTNLINQELKYLVAAHENISFEEKSQQDKILKQYTSSEKEEKPPVDINEIKSRIDKLFGQDELYERVKEKLVGITIKYYPALQDVCLKLIRDSEFDENLQLLLIEQLSFYEEYMIRKEHSNLRTFQFYLSKVEKLYRAISKLEGEGLKPFLKYIIRYSFKVCVCFKKDELEYDWKEYGEYTFKNVSIYDIFGSELAFRFVDDFIIGNALNEEKIKNMLIIYEDEYIRKKDIDPFRELESQWFLTDEKFVEEKINEIVRELENGNYETRDYPRIISLFVELEYEGFSKQNTGKIIAVIKENLKSSNKIAILDNEYSMFKKGEKKERFDEIIKSLQSESDKYFQEYLNNAVSSYLKEGDGWATNLSHYVTNNIDDIRNVSGFLSQLPVSQLSERIKISNSQDIHAFRVCLLTLYVHRFEGKVIKTEKKDLIELKKYIEEIDQTSFDKIKQMQLKYLISNLEAAINNYGEN